MELQKSERQAVISAHELAAVLQSEVSQATTACDSWKKNEVKRLTKRGGRAKHDQNVRRKLYSSRTYSFSTARNKLLATFDAERKS